MRLNRPYKSHYVVHHTHHQQAHPQKQDGVCDEPCIRELSRIFWTNPGLKYEEFSEEVRSRINALTQRDVATEDWEKYWLGSNYDKGTLGPFFAAFFQDAGQWQALFADFDLSVTGQSMQDTFVRAQELLSMRLQRLIAEGEAIPHACTLSDAQHRIDMLLGVLGRPRPREIFVQMVPCNVSKERQVKVSVSFPETLLAQIDEMASALGLSRSAFLAKAALSYK